MAGDSATALDPASTESGTRTAVLRSLLEDGPVTAGDLADRLGLTAAGVRRHLEALLDAEQIEVATVGRGSRRGRGRPAKAFRISESGRARFTHAYDQLASDAISRLREVAGHEAIVAFARSRARAMVEGVAANPAAPGPELVETKAAELSEALRDSGFVATVRPVGAPEADGSGGRGVQICQHHCPIAGVAGHNPEFCDAETEVFAEILGTHVQRLATIANGDGVCTTHIPLPIEEVGRTSGAKGSAASLDSTASLDGAAEYSPATTVDIGDDIRGSGASDEVTDSRDESLGPQPIPGRPAGASPHAHGAQSAPISATTSEKGHE